MNLINVDYKSLAYSERREQEANSVSDSFFVNLSVSCIRHLYMTTLLEFEFDYVKDFWSRFGFRENGKLLENHEIYEYLWREDAKISLETQIEIFSCLNKFLLKTDGVDIVSRRKTK